LKKKILILGPLPPTIGGITTLIQEIMGSKLNEKYDFRAFDTQRPTIGFSKEVWDYTLAWRIGWLKLLKSSIWTLFHLLAFPFVLFTYDPDIVHINSVGYWVYWENGLYVLLSKIFHKKIFFHLHGGGFEDFYEKGNKISKFLIRVILDLSDRIIVLSPSWWRYFAEIAFKDKIAVVENFVDSSMFSKVASVKLSDGKITVLFVGGFAAKAKGLYDFVDAASLVNKSCSDIFFVLLACSDVKGLTELCNKKGIASNTKIEGYLQGIQKIRAFTTSDIFVLPSYAEGFPITMLEAMAAGLPVIASSVGAIPDVIENGKNGFLIKTGDYTVLAEKISILSRDKELRKEMGKKNLELISKKYNKQIVLEKLCSEYDKLI
jgi:glycosyltransferase involved in cell wall biosynthesis